MRFAAVPLPEPVPERNAAAEFLRRLVSDKPAVPAPARAIPEALPFDLDQRVRLVGEW